MGLGRGSNNYARLMALKLLLLYVVEQDCQSIQIFGDSMNVIKWVPGEQNCHNLLLLALLKKLLGSRRRFVLFLVVISTRIRMWRLNCFLRKVYH